MTTTSPQIHNGRVFTASNFLSISRVLLLVPILYYLDLGVHEPHYNLYAVLFMLLAGLTDLFDGLLARNLDQVTRFGMIIDPLADKVCTSVIIVFVALTRTDFPFWFLLIAVGRDAIIFSVGLYLKRRYNYVFMSNWLGKWAVTVLALSVTVFVLKELWGLERYFFLLLWLSVVLLTISLLVYARRVLVFLREQSAGKES
jgi:CDP-diacylglycerol--glycerol-3-phosphate 3-phosphatidyltransferase